MPRSTGTAINSVPHPKSWTSAPSGSWSPGAERARRTGDTEGAVEHLRDALDLWRGAALAGVRGDCAQTRRQRLGELRLSAETARITAGLDLGVHVEATAELTGLVTEHPVGRAVPGAAHARPLPVGRQSAALATYCEAQTLLAGEPGVDPGPALQVMYQRVLRADAGLLGPTALPEPERMPTHASAPVPAQAQVVPAQLPAGLAIPSGPHAGPCPG